MLIDMITSAVRGCHAKGGRKESIIREFIYSDTTNVNHMSISVTIRATRIVTNVLKKHLENTTGKHSSGIITIDTLGKSQATREVLQPET
jgi:hypothetical protein